MYSPRCVHSKVSEGDIALDWSVTPGCSEPRGQWSCSRLVVCRAISFNWPLTGMGTTRLDMKGFDSFGLCMAYCKPVDVASVELSLWVCQKSRVSKS